MVKKIVKPERGSIFIITLMVLVVMSILGTAILGYTLSNNKMSIHDSNFQSAYYIAETGVKYVTNKVVENIVNVYDTSNDKNEFFSKVEQLINQSISSYGTGSFDMIRGIQPVSNVRLDQKIDAGNGKVIYILSATGSIGGITRGVQQKLEVIYPQLLSIQADMAVFAEDNIELSGGAQINGPVGSNSNTVGTIKLDGGSNINGDCYVPAPASPDAVSVPSWMTKPNVHSIPRRQYTMPYFPEFPTYVKLDALKVSSEHLIDLSGNLRSFSNSCPDNYVLEITRDAYIPDVYIRDKTLTIRADDDIELVIDNIKIEGGGHLNLIGNGKVTMYIRNRMDFLNGTKVNKPGDLWGTPTAEQRSKTIEKLTVYYEGTYPISIGGDVEIYGSLYAKTADITLTQGGGFQGHIMTGSTGTLRINGGAVALVRVIYAPYADIIMEQGGNVKGAIIGKSLKATGGTVITYVSQYPDVPFLPGETESDHIVTKVSPIREKRN